MKNKKHAKIKKRDWKVVECIARKSGAHVDKRKEQSRKMCRKKVEEND
jgi:hypothetical protein